MKFIELEKKDKKDLEKLLTEKRGLLQDLRFKTVIGGIKNHREIRETRRGIAKILTKLNQNA